MGLMLLGYYVGKDESRGSDPTNKIEGGCYKIAFYVLGLFLIFQIVDISVIWQTIDD